MSRQQQQQQQQQPIFFIKQQPIFFIKQQPIFFFKQQPIFSPITGGCSEGLGMLWCFLKQQPIGPQPYPLIYTWLNVRNDNVTTATGWRLMQVVIFLSLQGKETNNIIRGHKLTQNKVRKNKTKIKDPEKVQHLREKYDTGSRK